VSLPVAATVTVTTRLGTSSPYDAHASSTSASSTSTTPIQVPTPHQPTSGIHEKQESVVKLHFKSLDTIPRACQGGISSFPFCDPTLDIEQRLTDLIGRIHTDEKPGLLTARYSPKGNISRIGLPAYDWGENSVHGDQTRCVGSICPTSFPNPNGLGAAFNFSIVQHMANIMGIELRALWLQGAGENHANDLPATGLDVWSPNINLVRDPRWGRNQETNGEDPFLNGLYGAAYTKGIQNGADDRYMLAIVTLKHWAAYSLENYGGIDRHHFDALVSKYDMGLSYTPAFRHSVVDGKAAGVMCSYNAVNRVPSCANQFLNYTLREAFGFDGYVTSDTGAVSDIFQNHHYANSWEEAVQVALHAGTDINSGGVYLDHMISALSRGLISEDDIDLALRRTLGLRFKLGLFDPIENQPYWHVPMSAVNTAESQEFNLFSTLSSLVLLQNNNKTLPFSPGKRVAVVGPHANATKQMVGNYIGQICPGGMNDFSCIVSPYLAIRELNDAQGGTTTMVQGCNVTGNDTSGFQAAVDAANAADFVVIMLGLDQTVEREGFDRTQIGLPGVQEQFALKVLASGKPAVIVLMNGGIVAIDRVKAVAPAILEAWYPCFQGGTAIAQTLFGKYNPGGKLPVTYYGENYVNEVDMYSMDMAKAPGRTYRYYTGTPLWPYGYGLSYTSFELTCAECGTPHVLSNNDTASSSMSLTVSVRNTGSMAGDEVVQVYYYPPSFADLQPLGIPHLTSQPLLKQLIAFERVHVLPGDTKSVTLVIDVDSLTVGTVIGDVIQVIGAYQLHVTNGVDQSITSTIKVTGDTYKIVTPFPRMPDDST
jgi:xylan 1,4-beta-xylosidase